MEEIAEYIMFNLHAEFFYGQQRSPEEIEFQRKCDEMEKMDEKAFDIDIDEISKVLQGKTFRDLNQIMKKLK